MTTTEPESGLQSWRSRRSMGKGTRHLQLLLMSISADKESLAGWTNGINSLKRKAIAPELPSN